MEEPINVRYTFMMMLAISDPKGYVVGTDIAIARRLNIKLSELQECLAVLLAPDPNSNSQESEGRRLIVSDTDRGYKLVNYLTYREMTSTENRRVYMREYMRAKRQSEKSSDGGGVNENANNVKDVALLRQEEAEANTEADPFAEPPPSAPTMEENFKVFFDLYPRKEGKPDAKRAYAKACKETTPEYLLEALARWKRCDQWTKDGGQFIPYAQKWLNKEFWRPEVKTTQGNGHQQNTSKGTTRSGDLNAQWGPKADPNKGHVFGGRKPNAG